MRASSTSRLSPQQVAAMAALAALLLLTSATAASAAAAACVSMCKPCEKHSDCCPDAGGGSCGCVRNRVPGEGAPELVCLCRGSNLKNCVAANTASALKKAAAAAGSNGTATAKVAKPKCLVIPPGLKRPVACVETATTTAGNGTATAGATAAAGAIAAAGAGTAAAGAGPASASSSSSGSTAAAAQP